MSRDYIRRSLQRLEGYVPGEQPADGKYIKLNTNENPYPPSPKVSEALARFSVERLRLYPDPVCRDLREQLAAYHGCGSDNILVGNGSDELLALCIRAFVERDEAVGFLDPSYSLYPVLAAIEGVATTPYPLAPDFTWHEPGPVREPLFFLANPNAPTGILCPRDEVRVLCEAAAGVVVIDEAYVDFAREHAISIALERDNVLVTRTLSKSFSLAGLRLGYAVGPEPLIAALLKIKDSYNVGTLAQLIAAAALDDTPHMRRNAKKICATRERVAKALDARSFRVSPSEANFLWISPPGGEAGTLYEALKAKRILVRYFPGEGTRTHLRVTIGTDDAMDAFLNAVDDISPHIS